MKILLIAMTIICAFGWLNSYVCRMAILYYYMHVKGQAKPSDEMMNECLKQAWRSLFKAD